MKIQALVTVLALGCGTAFAAQYSSGSAEGDTANRNQAATASTTDAQQKKGGGLIDKTKDAMHRMGDKMRSAGHRKDKDAQMATKGDSRSMGASGPDAQDNDRQRRMDDAYANWQKRQK